MKTKINLTVMSLALLGIMTSCESKKTAEESAATEDTTYVAMEVDESLYSSSEEHFDAALLALDQKRNGEASRLIGAGVDALQEEGPEEIKLMPKFDTAVQKLQAMVEPAREGKLSVEELKKAYWQAELMVAHYNLETWEAFSVMEPKANEHMDKVLNRFERLIATEEGATKAEMEKVIAEVRSDIKAGETATGNDLAAAKAKLKTDVQKIKDYVKERI